MDKKSGKSARSSLEKRPSGSLDSPGTGSGKGTGTGAGTGTRAARGSMDSLAIAASALNDPEDFDGKHLRPHIAFSLSHSTSHSHGIFTSHSIFSLT